MSAATRSSSDAIVDVSPPVVSVDAPANNSIVTPSSSVPVYATAYDESGIDRWNSTWTGF